MNHFRFWTWKVLLPDWIFPFKFQYISLTPNVSTRLSINFKSIKSCNQVCPPRRANVIYAKYMYQIRVCCVKNHNFSIFDSKTGCNIHPYWHLQPVNTPGVINICTYCGNYDMYNEILKYEIYKFFELWGFQWVRGFLSTILMFTFP